VINPINTYSGGGLREVYDSAGALTDDVSLAAGKFYPQGTVLGQILGTGTAVNEVQTITPTAVTAGTYQLVLDGYSTTPLAFNANNAAVQAALEALPNVGVGGIVVGGGPQNSAATTYTFSNQLGGLHTALLQVNASALTGSMAVALTTLGKSATGYWDSYNDTQSGQFAGLATAKRLLQYDSRVSADGKIYGGADLGADNNAFLRAAPAYFAGTFKTSDLVGLDANGVADLGKLIAGDTSSLGATTTILRMG